ncbi:MAG: RNA-binding protein [Gemmatimonadota bacterium]
MAKQKPTKKPTKLRPDAIEIAHRVMLEATGQRPKTPPPSERSEEEKDPEAVARGAKGGKKGGEARKQALTPERRRAIAKKAARARWSSET